MTETRTIEITIAVTEDGRWEAYGGADSSPARDRELALRFLDGERLAVNLVTVRATVPVPEAVGLPLDGEAVSYFRRVPSAAT